MSAWFADHPCDHARELMTLIEGTPDAEIYLDELAREVGISQEEAGRILEQLEREGKLRWEGKRPVIVEEPRARPPIRRSRIAPRGG